MAERLENIRKFQADVEQCMKCGFCGYYCPIYREERDEKGLARGKDQLIRFVLEGQQDLSKGFYQAIDNCLLCKTCVQYCPAKTRTDHAVTAARGDYVAEKGLPLAKHICSATCSPTAGCSAWRCAWLPGCSGSCPEGKGNSGTCRSSSRPFAREGDSGDRAAVPEKDPAGAHGRHGRAEVPSRLLLGLRTEYVFPEIGKMIVDVLRNLDCEVVFDRRRLLRRRSTFPATSSPGGRWLRETSRRWTTTTTSSRVAPRAAPGWPYPTYLAETPEGKERFERFAAKVKDFNEFVIDVVAADLKRFAIKPRFRGRTVTWHDPCHLARHQDVRASPGKSADARGDPFRRDARRRPVLRAWRLLQYHPLRGLPEDRRSQGRRRRGLRRRRRGDRVPGLHDPASRRAARPRSPSRSSTSESCSPFQALSENTTCHPERSEGSTLPPSTGQILRFAQNDGVPVCPVNLGAFLLHPAEGRGNVP